MLLNLDYLKKDKKYDESISEIKEDLIISKYIKQYKEEEYKNIFEYDTSIETMYTLSEISSNIIKWYPFKDNCSILEIGGKFRSAHRNLV